MSLPAQQVGAGDPLAAALMPVLLHRLNNATQLLETLGSLARLDAERDWIGERSADLAEVSARVEELGYVLAVLASAAGADLLQERRDPRGLELLVGAARDALRRERRPLAEPPGPLPRLAAAAGAGWEAPWAVASVLFAAGRDGDGARELCWSLESAEGAGSLSVEVAPGASLSTLVERLATRGGGVRLELMGEAARLWLPVGWLRFEART